MKIIDSHVHLGLWKNPDFFGRKLEVHELFKSMDEYGIAGSIVMPTDMAENEEILSSLQKYPGKKYRFVPWVKPKDSGALGFLHKNLKSIAGLKFHPSLDKTKATDIAYAEFIEFASENSLPIFVHCGRWKEMAGSEYPVEIAAKNRKLKVILSHMGGDTPKLAYETVLNIKEKKLSNVYLDTAGFREYWAMEKVIEDLGADKILFASDFPLGHPLAQMTMVKHLDIGEKEKAMILGLNALNLLNWET